MVIGNFYLRKTIALWLLVCLSTVLILTLYIFFTHGADARVDTPGGKASVSQSTYRAYNSSTTALPGTPLAVTNQAATLEDIGDPFRIRAGLTNVDDPYVPITIKQVAATSYYTCALASDDWVYCWSENEDGRLGTGRSSWDISAPTPIDRGDMPVDATIKSISASSSGGFVCAVASDDWVYCWGENDQGQLGDNTTTARNKPTAMVRGAVPVGATIKQVSTGVGHACVVASNDKAYCWGDNEFGGLGDNTTTDSLIPVAVSNGAMVSPYTVKVVSAGNVTSCAIATNNKAYCWGPNWDGRLATGNNTDSSVPVAIVRGAMPSGFTIKDISVGEFSVCVIANNDRGYCAGYNNGQLGSTPTSSTNTLRAIAQGQMPSLTIKKIVMAANHACAINTNSKTYCWGRNDNGQLGNNTTTDSATAVATSQGDMPPGQAVSEITVVYNHTCALATGGTAYCWGYNYDGRLGNGYDAHQKTPTRVLAGAMSDGLKASSVAYGDASGCGLADNDWLYCWGWNNSGKLGNGNTVDQTRPAAIANGDIPAGLSIKSFDVGDGYGCAIASDNWGYCWGRGSSGQLGNYNNIALSSPARLDQGDFPSGSTVKSISTGGTTACAIASDNWLYCWGSNSDGQRGVGYTGGGRSYSEEVDRGEIPGGLTIKSVSVGKESACAIASNNWAYCWGYNDSGQVGDNTVVTRSSPTALSRGAIPAGATIKSVSVGWGFACATTSNDALYCWGYNGSGQLGDDTTTTRRVPVKVNQGDMPVGATVKSVSAGYDHTCAVASDNWAYCWGLDSNGQTGWDGPGSPKVPKKVVRGDLPESATISSIETGNINTCLIDSNSRVYCIGWNDESGELGNGSMEKSSVPAKVDYGEYNPDHTIQSGALSLKLQYVEKPDVTACSAISSGWANVTGSSAMAFGSSPPANGSAISSSPNDPVAPTAGGFKYQTVVQSGTSFTNNSSIEPQSTGLWDFSLVDLSNKSDTSYCFRIVPTNGSSAIDSYGAYPVVTTTLGTLDVMFVDGSGSPIVGSGKNVDFPAQVTGSSVQTSSAKLADVSSKQLNISNSLSDNGWSVSLAASGSQWSAGGGKNYPYSDTSDNGRLSVDFNYATMAGVGSAGGSACTTTGLTLPSGTQSFSSPGQPITLLSGSASSQFGCNWRLRNVSLSQTIPKYQPSGDYKLDMTVTVVAQ